MNIRFTLLLLAPMLLLATQSYSYTRQDTLRGSNGPGRNWWNVIRYDLSFSLDTVQQTIQGSNCITFVVSGTPGDSMQIDLQQGMNLIPSPNYSLSREGNAYWIKANQPYQNGKEYSLELNFEGKPRKALNPPWDGGFIWGKDSLGAAWTAVACQGLGASAWWPCKDYQGDEPDSGMHISLRQMTGQTFVSNGRMHDQDTLDQPNPTSGEIERIVFKSQGWQVRNPINAYDATFYLGNYAHWQDTFQGENGVLTLDFYPLKQHEPKARKQWAVVKEMLRCFEYWLGPYPFYEDGYKLVEAPYLGMEHQSAVAYGNQYKMGYLGRDRSNTGIGLSFDFIIIHESAHEWFGNSITAKDIADNWIHEGFTTYVESLFAEWIKGNEAGAAYTRGEWDNIRNDRPLIGDYGVNSEGSSGIYDKGSAIVFMIRQMLDNDEKFRGLLRSINKEFYHKTITTEAMEAFIGNYLGRNLKPFFDQYLRSTNIPELHQNQASDSLSFTWVNAVKGFDAPIAISLDGGKTFKTYSEAGKVRLSLTKITGNRLRLKTLGLYTLASPEK